jgi:hypothetical protein
MILAGQFVARAVAVQSQQGICQLADPSMLAACVCPAKGKNGLFSCDLSAQICTPAAPSGAQAAGLAGLGVNGAAAVRGSTHPQTVQPASQPFTGTRLECFIATQQSRRDVFCPSNPHACLLPLQVCLMQQI